MTDLMLESDGTADADLLQRMLTAQQAISGCLVERPPTRQLFEDVLETLCLTLGWPLGVAWRPDGEALACTAVWSDAPTPQVAAFAAASLEQRFASGHGLPGAVWAGGRPIWTDDPRLDPRAAGLSDLANRVALPLCSGEATFGVLELLVGDDTVPHPAVRTWLTTVGAQLAQFLVRWEAQQTLLDHDRALAAARDGVVIADATRPGFPILYVNEGFERLTGYAQDEMLGRSCAMLQGADTDPVAVARIAKALAAGRPTRATLRNQRRDGTLFWNELHLSPVRDQDGRVVQYIGVQHDVTVERDAMAQASFLADHDPLTGLANRTLLQRVLVRAAARAAQDGTAVAAVFCDLDAFKRVNDDLGHVAGDEVLRTIAGRLRGIARERDLVARQGGDEFLVLMADLAPDSARAAALAVAGRVRGVLGDPIETGAGPVSVRASVGVSVLGEDAADAEELLRHADASMYRAKRTGRGVNAFRPTGPPLRRAGDHPEPGLAAELDRVLATGGVHAVYQPIVDLRTREVLAHEALARGPEGSPLQRPDVLFATARAAGRLDELDWVCRHAAVRGALAGTLPGKLFVNVEPEALGSPCPEAMAADVRRATSELDLVVEVTERAVTARPAQLLGLVELAREQGLGLALDDIGADIRSLALMPLLRPDVIKLDLRLVQQQPTTEIAEIIHAVNAERERTGAVILAEGIETEAHLATALAMGATVGQGWLFGRPGPLPAAAPAPSAPLPATRRRVEVTAVTPYEVVAGRRDVGRADKRLLLSISRNLEEQAAALGECGLIVSAFQTLERFTPATYRRYTLLAADAAFVGALGVGLPPEPAPGVRGASIADDDPLLGEWSVVVLGPHFAAALVAVDLGDGGPDMQRRFDFALTYDRELVVDAATPLMRRVAPFGR